MNRSGKNLTDRTTERRKLFLRKACGDAGRMNSRAEQAFVGVNVPHSAQDPLIEQQRFDASPPRRESRAKFFQCDFQGLRTQTASKRRDQRFRNKQDATEAADVCVTQFAAVVERKKNMCVRWHRVGRMPGCQLAGHPEMDDEIRARPGIAGQTARRKLDGDKFAEARDARDCRSG